MIVNLFALRFFDPSGNFGLLDKVKEDLSIEEHLSDDKGSASIDLFLQIDHLLVQGDAGRQMAMAMDCER